MTTVQEPLNGHLPQKGYPQDALFAGRKGFPPPFSLENPAELNRVDLPANKDNFNSNLSSGYVDTRELPGRCQFFFSDGRQCTMARSDIHPSLCRFHSEREDQLFGDPAPGGNVVGAALDLPELYSACGDLTTATGVNRALAQVFRLLALRRISRQEAATFGHLAQLLLRTISAMRVQESRQIEQPDNPVVERQNYVSSPAATNGRKLATPASAAAINSSLQPSSLSAPAEPPSTQAAPPSASTEQVPSASSPGESNSRGMSSYENVGLKPVQNEHLQKNIPGPGSRGRLPAAAR